MDSRKCRGRCEVFFWRLPLGLWKFQYPKYIIIQADSQRHNSPVPVFIFGKIKNYNVQYFSPDSKPFFGLNSTFSRKHVLLFGFRWPFLLVFKFSFPGKFLETNRNVTDLPPLPPFDQLANCQAPVPSPVPLDLTLSCRWSIYRPPSFPSSSSS